MDWKTGLSPVLNTFCVITTKSSIYSYSLVLSGLVAQRHCRENHWLVYSSAFRYKYFTEFKPMLGCGFGSNDSTAVFNYWGLKLIKKVKKSKMLMVIMFNNG